MGMERRRVEIRNVEHSGAVDLAARVRDNAELMAKRLGKNRVQPANTSRSLQSSYDE